MADLRKNLENGFENFGHIIYRNRIKSLIVVLVVALVTGSQIPKLTSDLSMEVLLHKNDPIVLDYDSFRDQFGRDAFIVIALKPPEIFSQTFLIKLKALHEDLEENMPHVEEVTSLINARNTYGKGDELIVGDLFEKWPRNDKEMGKIKKQVLSNPMYENLLISKDGKFTAIIIKTNAYSSLGQTVNILEDFENDDIETAGVKNTNAPPEYLTDEENREAVMAAHTIIKKYETDDFPIYLAGSPATTHFLAQAMFNDMRVFMLLAVTTIIVFLFIMFRRISGVLLPLSVVILSVISSMGIMAAVGIPLTIPTQIIPSFLTAVGVGSSVHILVIFYRRLRFTSSKEDAIAYALGHSGLPIVMTNITTGCGLLSFSTAAISPIAHLGIFACVGVMISLVYTLVMLPTLLALVPIKIAPPSNEGLKSTIMDRILTGVGNFSTRYPYPILIISAILIVASIFLATKIRFSHDPLNWLPENSPIRVATEVFDREMRGSLSLEIVIDTGIEDGLFEVDLLNRLNKAETDMEAIMYEDIFVGKAVSLVSILKEIHQALNENKIEYYTVPQNRDLIAQEFLLFENSGVDDLNDFVDSHFSKTRFSIKIPFKDGIKYTRLMNIVTNYFKSEFHKEKITVTGIISILTRILESTITSMAKSYIIAFVVISVLMILLIGGVRIGMFSMIPNITPILLMLGLMKLLSLPMDLFAMMVGSIAIGLAVDDTIHFMHNFRRYYKESGDPKVAVHKTLQSTGRAMLVTTIVLSIGFFIYMFATLENMFNFGLLTGFTICMALIADYFLAPALMVVVNKKRSIEPTF